MCKSNRLPNFPILWFSKEDRRRFCHTFFHLMHLCLAKGWSHDIYGILNYWQAEGWTDMWLPLLSITIRNRQTFFRSLPPKKGQFRTSIGIKSQHNWEELENQLIEWLCKHRAGTYVNKSIDLKLGHPQHSRQPPPLWSNEIKMRDSPPLRNYTERVTKLQRWVRTHSSSLTKLKRRNCISRLFE